MSTVIPTQVVSLTIGDRPAHAVVPVITEETPPELREALARRALIIQTGECPCGGRLNFEDACLVAAHRGVLGRGYGVQTYRVPSRHAADCPASDANLTALLHRLGYLISYAGGPTR